MVPEQPPVDERDGAAVTVPPSVVTGVMPLVWSVMLPDEPIRHPFHSSIVPP